jgi:HlyD family secretion protein
MEKKKRIDIKNKKVRTIAIALAAVVVVGLGFLLFSPKKSVTATAYTKYTVRTGNIETTVSGSGSVSSSSSLPYSALAGGVGTQVTAMNGQKVSRGDLIAVLTAGGRMPSSIAEDYMSLTRLYTSSGVTKVLSPAAGRVKLLRVKNGDDVNVLQKSGVLCMISTDGDMYVEFVPAKGTSIAVNQKVYVEVGGKKVSGTVVRTASQGLAKVLITTDVYDQGMEVKIQDAAGTALGEGRLMINAPVAVVATGGYVSSISVKENSYVSRGSTLMRLVQTGLDSGTIGALAVTAPDDGFVADLEIVQNASLSSGSVMFNLMGADSFTLTVSVDELDIANVKTGQTASVSIDALPDATFTGTVLRTSSVGTSSGGVATYDAIVEIAGSEGILPGMSASAEIQTAHKENVVLVPSSAIVNRGGKKYVMLASALAADNTVSNTATFDLANYQEVVIGITNGTLTEIVSGLEAGTQIAYRQSSSGTTVNFGPGSGSYMIDMGGQVPGGGQNRPQRTGGAGQ